MWYFINFLNPPCSNLIHMFFLLILSSQRLEPLMQIDQKSIKNKQRILIAGNQGTSEIIRILKSILSTIGKSVDFWESTDEPDLTDAPVLIIDGGLLMAQNALKLQDFNPHILLIHQVEEQYGGFSNFNEFVKEFEKLADSLPKAGTLIFNESNDVAVLLGKKEREDVKNIEYSALDKGFTASTDTNFLSSAGAARALLQRIGVSEEQLFAALKKI